MAQMYINMTPTNIHVLIQTKTIQSLKITLHGDEVRTVKMHILIEGWTWLHTLVKDQTVLATF